MDINLNELLGFMIPSVVGFVIWRLTQSSMDSNLLEFRAHSIASITEGIRDILNKYNEHYFTEYKRLADATFKVSDLHQLNDLEFRKPEIEIDDRIRRILQNSDYMRKFDFYYDIWKFVRIFGINIIIITILILTINLFIPNQLVPQRKIAHMILVVIWVVFAYICLCLNNATQNSINSFNRDQLKPRGEKIGNN